MIVLIAYASMLLFSIVMLIYELGLDAIVIALSISMFIWAALQVKKY